jgi:hypothetical protein
MRLATERRSGVSLGHFARVDVTFTALSADLRAIKKYLNRIRNVVVVVLVTDPEFHHSAAWIVKQDRGGLRP